jgi:hypothetical protein
MSGEVSISLLAGGCSWALTGGVSAGGPDTAGVLVTVVLPLPPAGICGDNVGGPGEVSGDLMLEDGTLYWMVVPDGMVMVCDSGGWTIGAGWGWP